MDFGLDDEQRAIVDTVRTFVQRELYPHEDEVDRLVEAWSRERPDLDVRPLDVLSRVTRLARYLDRARRNAFAAHELALWEFDVLSALRRSGRPYRMSPGGLLNQTLVTSGTMTNRIDRLTERGLVRREDDPNDRRSVLVKLTATGEALLDRLADRHLDELLRQEPHLSRSLRRLRRMSAGAEAVKA